MPFVIINLGMADGSAPPEGRYLKAYNPDWTPPWTDFPRFTGLAAWTDDLGEAMRFPRASDALAEYMKVSERLPIRPGDGKPNRPLTAYTIIVEPVP